MAEAGVPGYEYASWYGFVAPAGTPKDIVHKLSEGFARAIRAEEARMRDLGQEPVGSTPEGMAKRLADDIARWRGVITKLGLQR